jgi:hypothetical protein
VGVVQHLSQLLTDAVVIGFKAVTSVRWSRDSPVSCYINCPNLSARGDGTGGKVCSDVSRQCRGC